MIPKNKLRHPDFFNLKRKIETIWKPQQLESLREILTKFVKTNKGGEDANDLMILFLRKEEELNPYKYEDELLNIQHKKLAV